MRFRISIFILLSLFPFLVFAQSGPKKMPSPNSILLGPVSISTIDTLASADYAIDRNTTYRLVLSVRGPGAVAVRVRTIFRGVVSGYLTLDSVVVNDGGITRHVLTVNGDSLMDVWLPDDAGSRGAAGIALKSLRGETWSARFILEGLSAGEGVATLVYTTGIYTPVSTPQQIVYRADSGSVFISPQWFWDNLASSNLTVTQLSDSLDGVVRSLPNIYHTGDGIIIQSINQSNSSTVTFRTIKSETGLIALDSSDEFISLISGPDALTAGEIKTLISDSLNTIPRNFPSTIDTTNIYGGAHIWMSQQIFDAPWSRKPTPLEGTFYRIWDAQPTDTSRLFGMVTRVHTAINPSGLQLNSTSIGFNPDGAFVGGEGISAIGGWLKWEDWYDDTYASPGMQEFHYEARGMDGTVTRPFSLGIWNSNGRGAIGHIGVDRFSFYNTPGVGVTVDSMALDIFAPQFGLPGSVKIQNAYLDFGRASALGTLSRLAGDSSWHEISSWNNATGEYTVGSAGNVNDYWRIKRTALLAGPAGITAERLYNRTTLLGRTIIRDDTTVYGRGSNEIPTKKYVDEVRDAIPTEISDSLAAHVTYGPTIRADTASLAAVGDAIYARSGGGGGITAEQVRDSIQAFSAGASGYDLTLPAGTIARLDSAVVRTMWRDTTATAYSDSGAVMLRWIEVPRFLPGFGGVGQAEIVITGRLSGAMKTFNIRFDSANSVSGLEYEARTIGWDANGYWGKRMVETAEYTSTKGWGASVGIAWPATTGLDNRRVSTARGLPGGPEGSATTTAYTLPLRIYAVEGTADLFFRAEIRVMFRALGASTWYLKVTDL